MSKEAFSGTGVNLSSSYFMRSFYADNRAAFAKDTRDDYTKTQLSKEDSRALRRAVKKLGNYSFDDNDSTNVRNNVKALIQTYNNLITSGGDSSDRDISRNTDKLESLVQEYADELDAIGITVNEDHSMTVREDLFANADIAKFEKLFSEESDFTQKLDQLAKRINRYSDEAILEEKHRAEAEAKKTKHISLEQLCNQGIGDRINYTL